MTTFQDRVVDELNALVGLNRRRDVSKAIKYVRANPSAFTDDKCMSSREAADLALELVRVVRS